MPNEELEIIARRLWKKHGLALEYLMDQRPVKVREISIAIRLRAFDEIQRSVEERTKLKIELDHCSNTYLTIAVPAWDDLRDVKVSSWTASKRILLCQLEFYGERVHIRMQLGPGETEPRNRLLNRFINSSDINKNNKIRRTNQWTRLSSKTLLTSKDFEDNDDVDNLIKKSKDKIVDFLVENLPIFDSAMRESS